MFIIIIIILMNDIDDDYNVYIKLKLIKWCTHHIFINGYISIKNILLQKLWLIEES